MPRSKAAFAKASAGPTRRSNSKARRSDSAADSWAGRSASPASALGLTDDACARARRLLMRRDPKLAELMKRIGPCRISTSHRFEPFAGLVKVILSQQLSSKAADTIYNRVVALAGGADALSPASVLALDPAALRTAGVSWPKIGYLRDLAERVHDGRLDLAHLESQSDDQVIDAIVAVKGLGRWSAEMFLMFRLNRPDVFPMGDLGIVKGMQKLFEMKRRPAERTMERLAKPWRPYRSIAAWYLWRI